MKKMRITLTGETAEIVERLCTVSGLTPPNLVALLLRKSSRELESWIGSPVISSSFGTHTSSPAATPAPSLPPPPPSAPATSPHPSEATLELPTDSGDGLTPIEL